MSASSQQTIVYRVSWAEIGIGGNTDADLRCATKRLFLHAFRVAAARSVSWRLWMGFRMISGEPYVFAASDQ